MYAGGGPPTGVDFIDRAYRLFPWLVLTVLVLTYIVLLRAFRSVVLPLKAVILNVLSITATYGILVITFKWGAGQVIGLTQSNQIEAWIPIFLFAMLFGLSMDYEVFLLSRMREIYDETGDTEPRRHAGAREDRPDRHRGRGDHGGRVLGIRDREPARACRSSAGASRSPSLSTRPSSGPCWCRR